ncbi:anti-anti-sigma regulatory factor [Peribacillus deserti]|uniref:Anti-anti-sigma regulatory factor n=1 Tax=Peribacillus deserti TaxID=673318 RepID=A0ABS2QEN2_9BACI|nr:STAS domain-containing protein [Peribacillus deserti]MBM7691450.1 anti-anti-sigma regulatory factor [Peribacillus deserti]
MELSVPVIPLTKGVGVLPLIRKIDIDRAQLLMEQSLKHAVQLKLTYLIFDLSGVPLVDTMAAQQIFHVIQSLQLIGVKTILTGIRPEIARTMVSLGTNKEEILVKASLEQALKHTQSIKQLI